MILTKYKLIFFKNLNKKHFFFSSDTSSNIFDLFFRKENLYQTHLKLKRNIFLQTTLNLKTDKYHQLTINSDISHINTNLKDEITGIIMDLMPCLTKQDESLLNISGPEKTSSQQFLTKYYPDYDFYVYKECKLRNLTFSYITDHFLDTVLQTELNFLSVTDQIQFIPYDNASEVSRLKLRYLTYTPESISFEQRLEILSKCL